VWHDGVGSFETAVGVADRGTGRPLSVTDRFHIGSITKTFTATLVLQLAQRGKLDLGDRLSEYVRRVPLARRITIRDLLDMTSGIHDYVTKGFVQRRVFPRPHRNWRSGQMVRTAVRLKRYFARPSRHWHYASTNYILLGEIIKRVTGKRIRSLLERRVLDRLGMAHTTFRPRERPRERFARGYIRRPAGIVDTTDWNLSYAWTAGGASSTLGDLRRWAPALATGEGVLGDRMQRKRLRPLSHGPTGRQGYGLGISAVDLAAGLGKFLGHDGAVPGYDSFVAYSPSSRITVAALGNTSVELKPLEHSQFDPYALAGLAEELVQPLSPQ
jgi:D-alanyl-D-alanine carboxypeptidase